ncbi:MAG: hypothetical protein ACR2FG_05295 [Marmoricola sp.]
MLRLFARDRLSVPPLTPMPPVAELPAPLQQSGCRYLGTVSGEARVRVRGLGSAGQARIQVSTEGVDVVRLAGSFRIPGSSLRSARDQAEFDGKVAGPHGALVIRHGEQLLDSGFRLQADTYDSAAQAHRNWARSVSRVARSTHG